MAHEDRGFTPIAQRVVSDRSDEWDEPRLKVDQALSPIQARLRLSVIEPRRHHPVVGGPGVGIGPALVDPAVEFPQRIGDLDGHPKSAGNDLGRLERSGQRTRQDAADALGTQRIARSAACWRPSGVRPWGRPRFEITPRTFASLCPCRAKRSLWFTRPPGGRRCADRSPRRASRRLPGHHRSSRSRGSGRAGCRSVRCA